MTDGGAMSGHAFWDTQPVGPVGLEGHMHCPVELADKEVRRDPYPLPEGFQWATVDVGDTAQLEEVRVLLADHYVGAEDGAFRFAYPAATLQWALCPPKYHPEWHVGVRATRTGKLLGFIAGVPATVAVWGTPRPMCEINFLCVHEKLRCKRLAPVLIKEVTRRVNLRDVFQAVYTAGVALPGAVAACRYHFRPLHVRKLVDIGFMGLPSGRITVPRAEKLYRVPEGGWPPGARLMVPEDVPAAWGLFRAYMARFQLRPLFADEAEFAHWLLPRPGVVATYVVPAADGALTDLFSLYCVPSSVTGHSRHKDLRAGYCYYLVPGTHTLAQLVAACLTAAKALDLDVLNALDCMDMGSVVAGLKFLPGDGHLHYYLYNWACPALEAGQVGLVLV
jgi:glycylpeptide N-tetradecanoyltransferase